MRKILGKILLLCLAFNMVGVKVEAQEQKINLENYVEVIENVNEEYNQSFYIMSEEQYYVSSYYNTVGFDYEIYLSNITMLSVEEFEEHLIDSIIEEDCINVNVSTNSRSTLGSKTVIFNNSRNSMTLKYKYNGNVYDTSYTPTATVARISSQSWFVMSSYTGSFKNSNTTYTVVAKGTGYTTMGIAGNQSFTVNFNL